jgi:hypothetical protein
MSAISSNQLGVLAPLAAPLPDGPSDQFFTDEQWTTLMAIFDTVIPSVRRESTTGNKTSQLVVLDVEYNAAVDDLENIVVNAPDSRSLDKYLGEKPSDNPAFQDVLKRALIQYTRDDGRKGLAFILSALK